MLARTLDILEFRCVYPTVQMTTGEINPLVQYVKSKFNVVWSSFLISNSHSNSRSDRPWQSPRPKRSKVICVSTNRKITPISTQVCYSNWVHGANFVCVWFLFHVFRASSHEFGWYFVRWGESRASPRFRRIRRINRLCRCLGALLGYSVQWQKRRNEILYH